LGIAWLKSKVCHFSQLLEIIINSHEFKLAWTASGDGTSNKHIGYYSQHANIQKLPGDSESGGLEYDSLFFGLETPVDGTAGTLKDGWLAAVSHVAEVYNDSPLEERSGNFLQLVAVISWLFAMNSDHCSTEKKVARFMGEEVHDARLQILGEDEVLDQPDIQTDPAFEEAQEEMVKSVGGPSVWDALSHGEKALKTAMIIKNALISLGESAYASSSEEDKRLLDFYIWVGCGCHKDANSVKGGNSSMIEWWEKNGIPGPVPLANQDNRRILDNAAENGNPATSAEELAHNATTCGGVKAADIAGAIFHHKDDKKGQGSTFTFWFENEGIPLTFPNTSSVRYGSHCEAASVLMEYHDAFLRFLEYVRDAKDRRRFSNMEKNLYTALKCNATLTELATLALYGQAITHPYMREIRGKANRHTNMLDLGPLHKKVEEHIQRISDNPDILLSQTATYATGALDGLKWERPGAVTAILAMKGSLPHLSALISAFFSRALETWKHFTTEFTPGGIIDGATDCEKELAWVPATNDANESILGVLRQFMRYHPNASLALFNAQMKYQRNGTQEWEEKYVEEEDYKYVMNRVRAGESTGADKNRKKKLILAQIGKVERERAARKKAQRKKKERNAMLAKVDLIFDKMS